MVSRKNLGKTAGWITQPQNMIGNWVGQQIGTGIKSGIERIQNKGQNFSVNNYKSNLNMPTYNSRYPGFDEADYKKLEQGAINRGLTGEQKTQFMDEAYQYYYPQVLNKHGLDKRAEEINKIASENGQSILNGDKNVSRNLKLVDLAQTAKRVKGFAYDYPDEQVIEAMKTEIPDGEQLILNYLNNGDDTILYKAGLKKTDAQIQLDSYNKNKESINKALMGNWRELSDNGIKYLNNYTTLYNIVDEARQEGMGQGMTDNDLLLNLAYLSPEIQQIVNETENLTLDNEDKAIFGMLDKDSVRQDWDNTKQNIRDFLGWNSETPATLNDIAEEMYVRENRGGQAVKNAKANWRTFGDTLAKFGYRLPRDIQNLSLEADLKLGGNLSQEDVDRIKTKIGINKQEVQAFNEATEKDQQSYKNQIGLDPIIENYYSKQGLFESLLNEKGFGYKSLGEATANIDMLAGIGGSIINPVLGLAIMGTDTFARENQDAFETLMNAQTKQGVSYEDAYNNAVKGAVVVGGLNTVIELGLEKFLGGVETSTAKNIKEFATRDLNKEVSEMITKKGILEMLGKGLETQARSSLEEGMEEVFQQLVSNIAESGYDPDKQISEGLWRAFESGALNPMNLLAGGSELLNGGSLSEADRQTLIEWANSLNISNPIQGTYNPKSIVENIKNGTSNITSNTQGIFDRITDWGAEKITDTVSPQDKLYKAQEPLMQTLTKSKDLEKKRGNSDRANQLILENGFMPTDTSSRLEAHDTTMKNIWQQIEDKINGGKEIMIDLSEISNVLDEFIAKQKRTKSTLFDTDLERLSKESAALRGQQISLPDVERLKQGYNAKINNWGDEKVSDVMANGLREATHKIGVIEDNLLSEIPGEFQALKNDFGALKDTYEDVFKADMRNQRRKGGTLAETYSRIEGISDIVNGVLGTLTGKGDLQSIAKGGAKILVGKSLAKAKNVDFLIEQGFKGLAEELGIGGAITDNNITPITPTNPTDTVISENVNEMAGNQAQELYNQEDKNLSPNSEQMTEPRAYTAEELGLGKIVESTRTPDIQTRFNNELANMKNGERLLVTELFEGEEVSDIITKTSNGFKISDDAGTEFFIKNEELGPNGLLTRNTQLVSFENIGKMK